MGMEEEALRLLGLALLASEIDDDEIEFDEDGRITKLPSGFSVEYLVSLEGYSGGDWLSFSETVYGGRGFSAEEIQEAVDAPPVYLGKGNQIEPSISETPIRTSDIPKKARTFK